MLIEKYNKNQTYWILIEHITFNSSQSGCHDLLESSGVWQLDWCSSGWIVQVYDQQVSIVYSTRLTHTHLYIHIYHIIYVYIVPSTCSTTSDVQRYIPHIQPMKHAAWPCAGSAAMEALTKEMVLEAIESWQSLSVVPGALGRWGEKLLWPISGAFYVGNGWRNGMIYYIVIMMWLWIIAISSITN